MRCNERKTIWFNPKTALLRMWKFTKRLRSRKNPEVDPMQRGLQSNPFVQNVSSETASIRVEQISTNELGRSLTSGGTRLGDRKVWSPARHESPETKGEI